MSSREWVLRPEGVSKQQMTASYWIGRERDARRIRMDACAIAAFNRENARDIPFGTERIAFDAVPENIPGEQVKAWILENRPVSGKSYRRSGEETDAAFWKMLEDNTNLSAVPARVSVRYGIAVCRGALRSFPSGESVTTEPGDRLYDELSSSEILPFSPLLLLHESADGAWVFAAIPHYMGWVRKEQIALCENRAAWEAWRHPSDFLVVTGRETRLPVDPYAPSLSGLLLPMGTVLPLCPPASVNRRAPYGCYTVKLPVREENGSCKEAHALLSMAEDLSVGYLEYTGEAVLTQAFKLLGDRYGWGGDYAANDCSGIVKEIFSCFGFSLPRNASQQIACRGARQIPLGGKSPEEKRKLLAALPAGTLLHMPGHITLLLGVDGEDAYVLSATGSFSARTGEKIEVGTVVVTALDRCIRKGNRSWMEALDAALVPEREK